MYVLKLEDIGNASRAKVELWGRVVEEIMPGMRRNLIGQGPTGPWCARICRDDGPCGLEREFIHPMVDYSESSGNGNRGIYRVFFLRDGVYEVYERTSWKRSRRYFIEVRDHVAHEITERAVSEYLNR